MFDPIGNSRWPPMGIFHKKKFDLKSNLGHRTNTNSLCFTPIWCPSSSSALRARRKVLHRSRNALARSSELNRYFSFSLMCWINLLFYTCYMFITFLIDKLLFLLNCSFPIVFVHLAMCSTPLSTYKWSLILINNLKVNVYVYHYLNTNDIKINMLWEKF